MERGGFRYRNDTHTTEERGALFLAIGKTQQVVAVVGRLLRPAIAVPGCQMPPSGRLFKAPGNHNEYGELRAIRMPAKAK